jgi:hypothetical protein
MAADFKDIKDVFESHHLHLPILRALIPDAEFYEVLAIQPEGIIETSGNFIGHSDRLSAQSKFSSFLSLAVEKSSDLVLTPEYSCPWEVLANAIDQSALPETGKLWILGLESITPYQLRQFIADNSGVVWIHEPIHNGSGTFLGVLAYVIRTKTTTEEEKCVIVLQFKTQFMGGNPFERDHLICGEKIYLWHNPQDNIRLISLICAEALTFDNAVLETCRFDLHPYMVFHPQLVKNPRHADHRDYRKTLFTHNLSERFEVLTLNWARGFSFLNSPPNPYGGSAIYLKSDKFSTSDARLESNHQKGLFYTYWHEHRTNLCIFSFDQHVFRYRTPKTVQNVKAVLGQRTGPEMLSLFSWDQSTGTWKDSAKADDGFDKLCRTFPGSCDFCQNTPHTSVDRERLFTLSAGKLQPLLDWHAVREIDSFVAESDERSKRITFTHEDGTPSRTFRHSYLERYIELQTSILTKPENFPDAIGDLSGNCKLQPPNASSDFRFNLIGLTGDPQGATAIYIGSESREAALQLKDNLMHTWGQEHTRRLVIWYKEQDKFGHTSMPTPGITDHATPPGPLAN